MPGPVVSPQFPCLLSGLASALREGLQMAPWGVSKVKGPRPGRRPLSPPSTLGLGGWASPLELVGLGVVGVCGVACHPACLPRPQDRTASALFPRPQGGGHPSWDGCDTRNPKRNICLETRRADGDGEQEARPDLEGPPGPSRVGSLYPGPPGCSQPAVSQQVQPGLGWAGRAPAREGLSGLPARAMLWVVGGGCRQGAS